MLDSIRSVDFRNFAYQWSKDKHWLAPFAWQQTFEMSEVRLTDGEWPLSDSEPPISSDFKRPFAGLTLDEIKYGDLIGDSKEEAVVILRYDTGGTQYYYWLYIYGLDKKGVTLLAYVRTGSRAHEGLDRLSVRRRILTLEVFDPEYREGDCCSNGLLLYRYRWDGKTFIRAGQTEKRPAKFRSRRRVSIFGMPEDQMR